LFDDVLVKTVLFNSYDVILPEGNVSLIITSFILKYVATMSAQVMVKKME
jgi:hypothetical protein